LLLFGTDVAAIVATGSAVLILHRVRDAAQEADYQLGQLRGRALALPSRGRGDSTPSRRRLL
jgi:hypothetical protein